METVATATLDACVNYTQDKTGRIRNFEKAAKRSGRHVAKSDVRPTAANLAAVVAAADAGAFRPVIEATYDFDQIVEAHRLLDTKRKRGNIVVRVP